MKDVICGTIYEHRKTKELLRYVPEKSIVFLWHEDIDGVTVDGLIKAKVKAVVNGKQSFSGNYVHNHVSTLLEAGIVVFDAIYVNKREKGRFNGETCLIYDNQLFIIIDKQPQFVAPLVPYTEKLVRQKKIRAHLHYPDTFKQFVENTMTYAKNECEWFQRKPSLPESLTKIAGKDVFIVARNKEYERDIRVMRSFLRKKDVIVIAVDGGADGLLHHGIRPDFIIGDMDSISDEALSCGAQLFCHENPNGSAPGLMRLKRLNIEAETIRFVGTSEDVAIASAYWAGARHLYLIGCRVGMTEFLEKSRLGMGATLLCRMQAGDRLTDLKGIHRLYEPRFSFSRLSIASLLKRLWLQARWMKTKEALRLD